jgi:hypothetical protein
MSGPTVSGKIDLEVVSRDKALEDMAKRVQATEARLKSLGQTGARAGKEIEQGLQQAGVAADKAGKGLETVMARLMPLLAAAKQLAGDVAAISRENGQKGAASGMTIGAAVNSSGVKDAAFAAEALKNVAAGTGLGASGVSSMLGRLTSFPAYRKALQRDTKGELDAFRDIATATAYVTPEERDATTGAIGRLSEFGVGSKQALAMTIAAQRQGVPAELVQRGLDAMAPAIKSSKDQARALNAAFGVIGLAHDSGMDRGAQDRLFGLSTDQSFLREKSRRGSRDAADVLESMNDASKLRIADSSTGTEGIGFGYQEYQAYRGYRGAGASQLRSAVGSVQQDQRKAEELTREETGRRFAALGAAGQVAAAQRRSDFGMLDRERSDTEIEARRINAQTTFRENMPWLSSLSMARGAVDEYQGFVGSQMARPDQGRLAAEATGTAVGAGVGMAAAGSAFAAGTAAGLPFGPAAPLVGAGAALLTVGGGAAAGMAIGATAYNEAAGSPEASGRGAYYDQRTTYNITNNSYGEGGMGPGPGEIN